MTDVIKVVRWNCDTCRIYIWLVIVEKDMALVVEVSESIVEENSSNIAWAI
jgi:hypothetical protein